MRTPLTDELNKLINLDKLKSKFRKRKLTKYSSSKKGGYRKHYKNKTKKHNRHRYY